MPSFYLSPQSPQKKGPYIADAPKKEQDSPYLSLFFMTLSAIFQIYKVLRWSLNSEINSLYDK